MDFWELYDRYYSRVHGYATSILRDPTAADDVVQETFMRAQANLDALRAPEKVSAWLFRIAHNVCMDEMRARRSSLIDPAADPDASGVCEDVSVERGLGNIEFLREGRRGDLLALGILEHPREHLQDLQTPRAGFGRRHIVLPKVRERLLYDAG